MKQVNLNVDDEFAAVGDALKGLISDIKAGKTAEEDALDAFGKLSSAMTAFGNAQADIKKTDNQAYLLKCLLEALEPAPAA